MYFHESEAIVLEEPDLLSVVEQIDGQLAGIFSPAPLRPADFSCALGCDTNQVVAIFELFAGRGLLRSEKMIECDRCHNLMPAAEYQQALEDEDGFECSSCGRSFRRRMRPMITYRMSAEVLARPKPQIPTSDIGHALRALMEADHVFQRWGHGWWVKFQGEIKFVLDNKGMIYIARLLSKSMRSVLVETLSEAVTERADAVVTTGNSEPLIDDQALAAYRDRLRELAEELDEAKQNHDIAHIERVETEKDSLESEIRRATGLGRRPRQRSDATRISKRVSTAINRAIESIREEHESLANHLDRFIDRGSLFRYAPEPVIDNWLT